MTPTQLKNMMIQRNAKLSQTLPERQFNAYQESRGLNLIQDRRLPFDENGIHYDFQCDFLRATDESYDVNFEIDGEEFHSSPIQLRKDAWKDKIKNAHGLKVIRIPAILTQRRYWPYLDSELPKALLSKEKVVRIDK